MGIKALHVAIPTLDIEKAVAFYTQLFGLKPTRVAEQYAHLYYGPHRISLLKTGPDSPSLQQGATEGKRSRHFGFHAGSPEEVDDLARRAAAMGATIVAGPEDSGDERRFFFVDPSGNQIEVYFEKTPSSSPGGDVRQT